MKCRPKYPCITPLKYRPKNPRLYFSEIKPLGLIHIQSLVSSWAVGLCNLVLMAVIGESCFVLVSCVMRAWTRSVKLTYIWLPALSAKLKNRSSFAFYSIGILGLLHFRFQFSDQAWMYCQVKFLMLNQAKVRRD